MNAIGRPAAVIVYLTILLSPNVTLATEEPSCPAALAGEVTRPREIVAYDPAERAQLILARTVALTTQPGPEGVTKAFATVQASIAPTLDRVGTFLQTRTNYATVFDRNEIAEQTQTVYDTLASRLERLRVHNVQTQGRKPWQLWRPVPSPELPMAITRIRALHHHVRETSARLRQNTELTQTMLQKARELKEALDLDGATLGALAENIAESELMRQVRVLRQDVLAQVVLIDNLVQMLEQRVQTDALLQERVRNLVSVVLPMVAMMGNAHLDLSPLDPEAAAARAAADRTTDEDMDQSIDQDRMSVKDIIASANATRLHNHHNSILKTYTEKYVRQLTTDDAVKLANATTTYNSNDWILLRFVKTHVAKLTVKDIKKLAKKAHFVSTDSTIFLTYARHHASTSPHAEIIELAKAVYSADAQRQIMRLIGL